MSEPIRVAVIGIGYGQQVHVPAFQLDGRCRVAAICAHAADRARAVADRLGIARATGDWRELVADPEVDALAIAVPPPIQATIVPAAAAAGKHVFCEKPVATSAAEARGLLEAVRRARVVHAVDFLFPELRAWQNAREVLRAGELGQVRHSSLTWRLETYAHRMRLDSWKLRREDGGGTLNNFVSHSFYYLEWLFGPITRLAARLASEEQAGDSRVDAWLEFASSGPCTLSVAADAYLGPGHRLEVYGERGTMVLENRTADHASGFTLALGTRASGALEPVATGGGAQPGGDGRVAATAAIVRRFIDAIGSGGAVMPGLEQGLRVQELLDASRDAAARGVWRPV